MYVTNITDENDNITICNCTTNDNNDTNIEIVIPLIAIIPCAMSLTRLVSLMVYTLFNKKPNYKFYLLNINGEVSLTKSSS